MQCFWEYSWTSHKLSAKMSSLGGCLQEVAAYESLDLTRSKFCLSIRWLERRIPVLNALFKWKVDFENKNPVLLIEKFPGMR